MCKGLSVKAKCPFFRALRRFRKVKKKLRYISPTTFKMGETIVYELINLSGPNN